MCIRDRCTTLSLQVEESPRSDNRECVEIKRYLDNNYREMCIRDRSIIAAVKDAVHVPVLGNGDIRTAEDAVQMVEETGCDGVMIARRCV